MFSLIQRFIERLAPAEAILRIPIGASPALCVLAGSISLLILAACDGPKGQPDRDGQSELRETTMNLPKTVERPDGTLEMEFGDLVLLLPANREYLTITPPHSNLSDGGPRVIGRYFRWPGLEDPIKYPPRSTPPASRLADTIHLRILGSEPSDIPPPPDPANSAFSRAINRLHGPVENHDLKLLEYRRPDSDQGVVYAPMDETLTHPGGQPAFVECSTIPTRAWGGFRECQARVVISPRVSYHYMFSDKWLKDWIEMDRSINQFVQGLILRNR